MASYPYKKSSNPYQTKKPDTTQSSYNSQTGVLTSGNQSYSVAPEKAGTMLAQVEEPTKKRRSKSSSSSSSGQAEQNTQTSPKQESSVSESVSSANNQTSSNAEAERAELREAYARSQARQRALAGEETLARKQSVEQTAIRIEADKRGRIESNVPVSKEAELNRDFSKARQEFQDRINLAQNQVFINGEEQTPSAKYYTQGVRTAGGVVALAGASAVIGVGKGGASAVKDVVTLQIIPKTFDFATEVVTNPGEVYSQLKSDFATNPVSFTTETIIYGAVVGKSVKVARSGEFLDVVKPINTEGAYTRVGDLSKVNTGNYKSGSYAESGQRFYADAIKSKDRVAELIVASAEKVKAFNEDLGKKGQVNAPNKRRVSKAEQKYQSRTGYTKSQIARGEKPGQSGTMVKSFTSKELLKNQQLQSKVAKYDYPQNLDDYKKFSIVNKEDASALTAQRKRSGYGQYDLKFVDNNVPKTSSSQSTTKELVSYGQQGDVYALQTGKVKVKYTYPAKKQTLNPKVVEPKKINPSNIKEVKDLITNVNEKGQEVFASISEPLNTITRGGNRAGGRIRDEIIARAKAKREAQLKNIADAKEIERQKNTLPAVVNNKNYPPRQTSNPIKYSEIKQNDVSLPSSENKISNSINKVGEKIGQLNNPFKRKKQIGNNYYSQQNYNAPQIEYAPRVSPEQLANTKSFTRELPMSSPIISQTRSSKINIESAPKVDAFQKYNPYQAIASQQAQAQLQKPGQIQGMSIASSTAQTPSQSVFQDLGQGQSSKQGQGQAQDTAQTPTPPSPEPPRPRSRNRPRPVPPDFQPRPEPPKDIFKPITTKPVQRKFEPIKPRAPEPRPEVFVPKGIVRVKPVATRVEGYDVFVRKKGKFQRVNIGALSKEEAINYGAVKVGTSASASFQIEPSKLGGSQSFKAKGFLQDFYKKGNIFIEKRERRIKSAGEKKEITLKGIQSQKFKRII